MDNQIIIPTQLRKLILSLLHSVHQGITSMRSRANKSVYWPGMNKDIRNTRYTCCSCNEIAPKQHQEPLAITFSPLWSFQKICGDYFEQQGHHYISIIDRFSAWLNIYHFPPTKVQAKHQYQCSEPFSLLMGYQKKSAVIGDPNLHLKYLETSFPSGEYIIESLQLNTPSRMEGQNLALKLQNGSL